MTGKAPTVMGVLRFRADGTQDDRQPIQIAGRAEYTVDPSAEDFIRRMVELRHDVRAQPKQRKPAVTASAPARSTRSSRR
jgi:hypothetical protein